MIEMIFADSFPETFSACMWYDTPSLNLNPMMNRRKQKTSICPSFGDDETVISDFRRLHTALAGPSRR